MSLFSSQISEFIHFTLPSTPSNVNGIIVCVESYLRFAQYHSLMQHFLALALGAIYLFGESVPPHVPLKL